MLTREALLQRISSGEVGITYSFDPFANPPEQISDDATVDPSNPHMRATEIFERLFFGDRLSLTLGPLVLSHTYGWRRGRRRYKGRPGIFDLRESDGKIIIQPRESITVNSNEQVTLGGHTAALTLARLSHATAGLVVAASYIDPCWDGLLVLQITNCSSRPFELSFGEKFAVTMFYDVSGSLPPDFQRQFARKSHHYGLSWERILASDADPFPLRKQPVPGVLRSSDWTIKEIVGRYIKELAVGGLTLAVLAAGLVYVGRLQDGLNQLANLQEQQTRQAAQLQQVVQAEEQLSSQRPFSGIITTSISSGNLTTQVQVPLPALSGSQSHFAFATSVPATSDVQVSASLALDNSSHSWMLTLTAKLPRVASSTEQVMIQWLVV